MFDKKQKEILLICPAAQEGRNLTFLMKLGGYGYCLARDVMEGVNYLHNCGINAFPLHLILVDSAAIAAGDLRELVMLQEIRRQMPLLVVNHGGESSRKGILDRLQPPSGGIYFCEPEEVVGTVKYLLENHPQGSDEKENNSEALRLVRDF